MATLKGLRSILAVGAIMCCSSIAFADPITVEFEISGFAGGATIMGSFSGNDTNGSGRITTNEVTAFDLTWSGNMRTSAFTHGLGNLSGLVYNIGLDLLRGLSSNGGGNSAGYLRFLSVASVNGPLPGGFFFDRDRQIIFHPGVTTTSVPEPGTLTLFGLGLLAIGFASRRRQPIG